MDIEKKLLILLQSDVKQALPILKAVAEAQGQSFDAVKHLLPAVEKILVEQSKGNEEIAKDIKDILLKVTDAAEISGKKKEVLQSAIFVENLLGMFKGEDGYTPHKEVDYFTPLEQAQFKEEVKPKRGIDYFTDEDIKIIAERARPMYGVDYFTSTDEERFKKSVTPHKGTDYYTASDIEEFLKRATPKKGIDYFDGEKGKDGEPGTAITGGQIVEKINDITDTDDKFKIDWKHIKNGPKNTGVNYYSGGAQYFTSLADVPHDFTGQAGKVLQVNAGGTGLEFVTYVGGSVDLASEVTGVLPYANGGTGVSTAFTQGSVIFAGASGFSEDNPNLFFDDTNNRLGIGTASPLTKLNVVETTTSSLRGILSSQFNTGTDGAMIGMRKARGTEGTSTTIVTGDSLGVINAWGYDGTNFLNMAGIEFGTSGTIAAGRVPTEIRFYTATDNAPSVKTLRMTLTASGNLSHVGTAMITSGEVQAGSAFAFKWSSRSKIVSPSDGVITLWNQAETDFGRLQFGGTTSSFPSISRNGAGLQFLLADGSANTTLLVGAITSTSSITAGTNNGFGISAKGSISAPSDGNFLIADNAGSSFGRLMLGGTTSSFPAIKRNTAIVEFRLADDSGDASIRTSTVFVNGNVQVAVGQYVLWAGQTYMKSQSSGVLTFFDAGLTGFDRLQFGGTTSSFPSIQRSGTGLIARLADNSANAPLTASIITASSDILLASAGPRIVNTGSGNLRIFGHTSGAGIVTLNESGGGFVGIGTTAPASTLHVKIADALALPVVTFEQLDVSEEMIEFITTIGAGNAIEAVGAKTLTTTHFIKVTLPGALTRYFPVGTIA